MGCPKKHMGDGRWLPHMATLTGKLCLLSHGICLRLVPRFSEKTHQTRGNSMASNLILPTFCQPFSEETTINHTSTPQKNTKNVKTPHFPSMFQARCLVTKTSLKAFSGTRFLACGGFSPCPWALPCAESGALRELRVGVMTWLCGEKFSQKNGDSMVIQWQFYGDLII